MDLPVDFFDPVTALPLRDSRPICAWCDRGKLDVIEQWSDSCGGIMGVTLKCDSAKLWQAHFSLVNSNAPVQINPHSSNSCTPSAVTATLFGGSPAPTSHPLTSA